MRELRLIKYFALFSGPKLPNQPSPLSPFASFAVKSAFSSPQPPEEGEEGDERQGEEDRAAFVVYPVVDHVRALVNAEIAKRKNAKAIAGDGERHDEDEEGPALPARLEEELSGDDACDE